MMPSWAETETKTEGHLNWYQNVELSGLHHHTKFEKYQSVNVWKQANAKVVFFKEITEWRKQREY